MQTSRRTLTEYRVRSVLAHGGMIAPMRQTYLAYRGPDTRWQMAGWVSPHIMARLRSAGGLCAQDVFPDRLIMGPAPMLDLTSRKMPRPADLLTRRAGTQPGLMDDLFSAAPSPDLVRQKAAAGRYRDEFRRASQPAAHRARADFGKAAEPFASRRLMNLEAEIGTDAMRRLEDLLVDRASVSALTFRWGMKAEDVKPAAQEALARLTEAYDLSPAVERPA